MKMDLCTPIRISLSFYVLCCIDFEFKGCGLVIVLDYKMIIVLDGMRTGGLISWFIKLQSY